MPKSIAAPELAMELRSSALKEADDAARSLESGKGFYSVSGAPQKIAQDLVENYRIKVWSASRFSSAHANRLVASTTEFLHHLKAAEGSEMQWLHVNSDADHHYLVARIAPDGPVIGCMRTVARTNVTRARWEELWGHGKA